MAEELAFENGRISNFEGVVTLDRVIPHTVVHHSLTSTYMSNFTEIEKKIFVHGRTYAHLIPASLRQLLKMSFYLAFAESIMNESYVHKDKGQSEIK